MREASRRALPSNRIAETRAFAITVRNAKREPVGIVVEDQVPVSTTDGIEVDDVRLSDGAERERETGLVRRRPALAPGETRTLDLRYTIWHPHDWHVALE